MEEMSRVRRRAGQITVFRICIFSLVLLVCTRASRAGFERRYSGTRSIGTAGALCGFGEDPWSFYYNPAHAAEIRGLSIFYVPSTLGVPDVKSTGLAYRDSFMGVDFAGAAQTFGFDLYRENVFTLNLSVPVYDFLFIGTNINANHLYIEDYGSDMAVSIDAGAKDVLVEEYLHGIQHHKFEFGICDPFERQAASNVFRCHGVRV